MDAVYSPTPTVKSDEPSRVPPNVKFEVDDAESEWPYNAPFDYIHARSLCGAIGDWPKLYGQALQHLKPGGWMECQEYEMGLHSDDGTLESLATNCVEYMAKLDEASEKFGKKMNIVRTLEGKMRDAGFEDVRSDIYKVVPSILWCWILSPIGSNSPIGPSEPLGEGEEAQGTREISTSRIVREPRTIRAGFVH